MTILQQADIGQVYHYTPLHYLPFIARAGILLSKPAIAQEGFPARHIRSMSSKQDVARGFAPYVHLTLDPCPPILKAKLQAGFPHLKLAIPASVIDAVEFSLCRYNVAMTRYLRKDGKPGFPESPTNGFYYDGQQVPVARLPEHKAAMLQSHYGRGTMIEVLVPDRLQLPAETTVVCFSEQDQNIAQHALTATQCGWECVLDNSMGYIPNLQHSQAVRTFLDRALAEPDWRGDGLEFDRV